jgi:serine/threonine protein phosphatase 1
MTDHTLYAIGDMHGYLDRLDLLLGLIEDDARGEPYRLLTIGDYIDRGPQSKDVIDRLIGLPADTIFLKGNHEQSMIDILDEPLDWEYLFMWDYWGGHTTLESYGVEQLTDRAHSQKIHQYLRPDKWPDLPRPIPRPEIDRAHTLQLVESFRAAVPNEHKEFLRGLKLTFETATHFFCHAGVKFDRPLDRQLPDTLLYEREPFISSTAMAAKIIVHGHTITPNHTHEVLPNRIGAQGQRTAPFCRDGPLVVNIHNICG